MRKWKKNESMKEFTDRCIENGVSPARQEQIDNQDTITDKDRLDFLQKLLKGNAVCRNSSKGRGFRLHQYRGEDHQSFPSVRDAIDHYMNAPKDDRKENEWYEKFITQDKETKKFIVWDETQAYEVCRRTTKRKAINSCLQYAKTLENNKRSNLL